MGAFKEIYDESVYLPEESSDQLELLQLLDLLSSGSTVRDVAGAGLLELLGGSQESFESSGVGEESPEVAVSLKPFSWL